MPSPWPTTPPSDAYRAAYADAAVRPFWRDTVPDRELCPPLTERREAELCIVGGGFTGLWAALYAKELDPGREVVVLEATRCGDGASSRNGGFLQASLTHGLGNGLARFPQEMRELERLGEESFQQLQADLERYAIDAEFEHSGDLNVALEPHQLDELAEQAAQAREHGHEIQLLDRDQVQAQVHSPLYLGGLYARTGAALVNPAKLIDGLRTAAIAEGVQIHEFTPVRRLTGTGAGVRAITPTGLLDARGLLIATSAYPPLLRRIGSHIAPVYDYALMTEPLSAPQMESIGWGNRVGIGDCANQFHYYRLSADDRILFGGYDAVYRYGGPVGPHLDEHDATFAKLSQHFFTIFPQLEGVRFTHRWGGAIDTCSRFSVFFGSAFGGRAVYALGYTGLGVGASRFGGRTALDLLDGRQTAATDSTLVRTRPLPFPPEPLRFGVIQLTRNRLAAADRAQGRRGLWLRALDRAGLGFDS
ncbi:MAG: NAD(P)/FAD-dependent oxidoreductase [Solirubrobacteraceae bacterium]